jgi:hypothetical protein
MKPPNALMVITVAPIIGQIVNTAFHVIWNHATKTRGHLGPIILCFLVGWFAQILLTSSALFQCNASTNDWVGAFTLNLASTIGFGYCYFTFVNLLKTSLRIRILAEMQQNANQGMTEIVLRRLYDDKEVTTLRIIRLQKWRQVKQCGENLYPEGWAFLALGRALRLLKSIMGLPIAHTFQL